MQAEGSAPDGAYTAGSEWAPPELRRFAELFNAGDYWESHEALEGAWRSRRSRFYQGLILYASAFVHARRGNAHGVRAQLDKAREALGAFRPAYLGVDVAHLLEHARVCRGLVAPPSASWRERLPWPHLELTRRHLRGDEPELSGENPLTPPD